MYKRQPNRGVYKPQDKQTFPSFFPTREHAGVSPGEPLLSLAAKAEFYIVLTELLAKNEKLSFLFRRVNDRNPGS